MTERAQMTDEWLRSAFDRAMFVGSNRGGDEDEALNDVLRGFANRVLQGFGDRQGMADALNIAYTKHKATRVGEGTAVPAPADPTADQEAFCDQHCCWSGHHRDCVRYDPPAKGVTGTPAPVVGLSASDWEAVGGFRFDKHAGWQQVAAEYANNPDVTTLYRKRTAGVKGDVNG